MACDDTLELRTRIERKSANLPRFVTVPRAVVAPWRPEGTLVVEVMMNGHDLGRRSLKPWDKARERWFLDFTQAHCERAGVDVGQTVSLSIRRADASPPEEIEQLVASDPGAEARWRSLSPARRRQIAEHVRAAKRPDTRARRARRALTKR